MVQSSNKPEDDGGEIDRIIQEIENMEKDMDKVVEGSQASASAPLAPSDNAPATSEVAVESPADSVFDSIVAEVEEKKVDRKVVPIRETVSVRESFVESDATIASHEPLAFEREASASQSGLSLKVGGCATIALEFEQNGIRVSLRCEDETLTITTDAGAEFKVPLRRSAA